VLSIKITGKAVPDAGCPVQPIGYTFIAHAGECFLLILKTPYAVLHPVVYVWVLCLLDDYRDNYYFLFVRRPDWSFAKIHRHHRGQTLFNTLSTQCLQKVHS